MAEVARSALQIMHLDLDADSMPDSPSDLADQEGPACVAGCYRCLMSYYNQPDHELLDRRDEDARTLLLRLANGRTVLQENDPPGKSGEAVGEDTLAERWWAEASRRGIPESDQEPLFVADRTVRPVWRRHYVAAIIEDADLPAVGPLEDLGFEVVRFENAPDWRDAFGRLATALGCAP